MSSNNVIECFTGSSPSQTPTQEPNSRVEAAKGLVQRHIRLLHSLVDNIMTEDFGLIRKDTITPEVEAGLRGFLEAMRNQSICQAMHITGTTQMPSWTLDKLHQYPNIDDFRVASEDECQTYWTRHVPKDMRESIINVKLDELSLSPSRWEGGLNAMDIDEDASSASKGKQDDESCPTKHEKLFYSDSDEEVRILAPMEKGDAVEVEDQPPPTKHGKLFYSSSEDGDMISTWNTSGNQSQQDSEISNQSQSSSSDSEEEDETMGTMYKKKKTSQTIRYTYADMQTYVLKPNINRPDFLQMPGVMSPLWDMYWNAMDMGKSPTARAATIATRKLFDQHHTMPPKDQITDVLWQYAKVRSLKVKFDAAVRLCQEGLWKTQVKRADHHRLYDGTFFAEVATKRSQLCRWNTTCFVDVGLPCTSRLHNWSMDCANVLRAHQVMHIPSNPHVLPDLPDDMCREGSLEREAHDQCCAEEYINTEDEWLLHSFNNHMFHNWDIEDPDWWIPMPPTTSYWNDNWDVDPYDLMIERACKAWEAHQAAVDEEEQFQHDVETDILELERQGVDECMGDPEQEEMDELVGMYYEQLDVKGLGE
ncbi:hypothetical protein EDC04DRAFT_2605592 [Pisolithus marmoratus]|nr:hypothetical protein EDC04DRAFT_2605592 [Pisolithus marmoratus]